MTIEEKKPKGLSDSELFVLLESRSLGGNPSWRLKQAASYFDWAAACIDPFAMVISDESDHLQKFEDVYLVTASMLREYAPELASRAEVIESKMDLAQNVTRLSVIRNVSLSSLEWRKRLFGLLSSVPSPLGIKLSIPDRGDIGIDRNILITIKGAIQRLAAVSGAGAREAERIWEDLQDTIVVPNIYDPRRIAKPIVIRYLEQAKRTVENMDLPLEVRESVTKEISFAITDLQRSVTPWNRVFSRVAQLAVIVGGLTAFGADAGDAYANIQNALHALADTAVVKVSEDARQLLLHPVDAPADATFVTKEREE